MRELDGAVSVRVAGHFGEWMQGRLGSDGPVVLVTLPCPALAVTVGPAPGQRVVDTAAIARFHQALGVRAAAPGLFADMPLGGGGGASTAGLLALGRAAGVTDPDRLAAACLAAERAVDPLMLPEPDGVLWAPRQARALAAIARPAAAEIVGGFIGPPVATDPEDDAFPDISDLVSLWRDTQPDLATAGAIATESALRTTALRGPARDPTAEIARRFGAFGQVRAHTGSARGLVFAPGRVPQGAEAALADAGATGILRFVAGTLR